mmetsp:Transcript_26194/g.62897  ORF Transcript_26194/g.62897 Transcript_26194/m.62897 type:complete len:213 (+) Transcript_26194:1038-1676(+)
MADPRPISHSALQNAPMTTSLNHPSGRRDSLVLYAEFVGDSISSFSCSRAHDLTSGSCSITCFPRIDSRLRARRVSSSIENQYGNPDSSSIMLKKYLVASSADSRIISTRAKKRAKDGRGADSNPRVFGARHRSSFGMVAFSIRIVDRRQRLTTAILIRQRTGQMRSSLGFSTADNMSTILSFLFMLGLLAGSFDTADAVAPTSIRHARGAL